MNKSFFIINLIFLFMVIPFLKAETISDSLAQQALDTIKEEFEDNLYLRLRIFQQNTKQEIFIKGWKVENAFRRLIKWEKQRANLYPYRSDPTYELNLKRKYEKYKNIYIVSFLFSFGDSDNFYGFYWWVDPKHKLWMDISTSKKLCQKYHLKMYPQIYRSTLKLVPYKNEIQSMLNE